MRADCFTHRSGPVSLIAAATLLLLSACTPGAGPGGFDSGLLGVTGGGAQDIAAARAKINSGILPSVDEITIEGFLSEHEIALPAPPDAGELYVSGGLAWRHAYPFQAPGADVFVGFGTTIDLESFKRPPLNLVIAVDRSGSMANYASPTDSRSKLTAVQQALQSLAAQLAVDDRVALVSFNHRTTVDLASAPFDPPRFEKTVNRLQAAGDTNLYEALQTAFSTAAASAGAGRSSRVILFTDALPNSGRTSTPEIVDLVRTYAEQGVGLTLMGVGYAYGDELAREVTSLRNGNAYYLSDADRIARIFEEEFKFLVAPAAEDVSLEITIPDGIGVKAVYGAPDYIPGSNGARIEIPTLFFSRREGGGSLIIVRLQFAQTPDFTTPAPVGSMTLRYRLLDGTQRETTTLVELPAVLAPGGEPPYFSDPALRRAAALLDTAVALREATIAASQGRWVEAGAMIDAFLPLFDAATRGLSDRVDASERSLSDERRLLEALRGIVR